MHFKFTTTNSIVCGAFILMYRPISSQYAANVQLLESTWLWEYRHQFSSHSFIAIFMVSNSSTWCENMIFCHNFPNEHNYYNVWPFAGCMQMFVSKRYRIYPLLQKLCRKCVRYVDNINCDNCYTKQNGKTINCNHKTHCIYYHVCCVYERMHLSLRAITFF